MKENKLSLRNTFLGTAFICLLFVVCLITVAVQADDTVYYLDQEYTLNTSGGWQLY